MSGRDAAAVVAAWREKSNIGRLMEWGPAAMDATPSSLNDKAADAFMTVGRAADRAADALMVAGFLSGHPIVRRLRGEASGYLAECNRTRQWAADLRLAEVEALGGAS